MKAMKDSISEVLETMFFLPVETLAEKYLDKLPILKKNSDRISRLTFNGSINGYALLFVPKGLASNVATDFLGVPENSITDDQINETLKEIINMIIGNILSKYDENETFDMGIPTLVGKNESPFMGNNFEHIVNIDISTLSDQITFFLFTDTGLL